MFYLLNFLSTLPADNTVCGAGAGPQGCPRQLGQPRRGGHRHPQAQRTGRGGLRGIPGARQNYACAGTARHGG